MKKQLVLVSSIVFLIGCTGKSAKQFATPNPPAEKVQNDYEVFSPTADILFVIDDSGSMSEHQANLSTNMNLFTDEFTKGAQLEYQIGVITTDAQSRKGRLVGTPTFVTPLTPNKELVLKRNVVVGINGSGTEQPFDAIAGLFAPANASYNAGFIRPAAALAVIIITDTEDQSDLIQGPQKLYDLLLQEKAGDRSKVLGYGAIVVPNEIPDCTGEMQDPNMILEFLKMVINAPMNDLRLCAYDFGQRLAALAQNIVSNAGRTIFLTRLPWVESIKVTYGSLELKSDPQTGWTYDGERNAILLAEGIPWDSQPMGSQIKVYFDAISPK